MTWMARRPDDGCGKMGAPVAGELPMQVHGLELADVDAFLAVTEQVRPADPREVPPLRDPLRAELAGQSILSTYARHRLFVAEDGGRPCGRIAAILNPLLPDESGAPYGQLGYFECRDDEQAARVLIEAGIEWLRGQGARQILAPMNGGAHRLYRFLVRGFERDPFLFEPRNPAYYPRLFEQCGFQVALRCHSYEFGRDELLPFKPLIEQLAAQRAPGIWGEFLDPSRMEETLARLHPLLDEFWRGHLGYHSITREEFAELFRGPLSLMTNRIIGVILNGAGEDVGLVFGYPDYVNEVRALQGDARGWGAWLGHVRATRAVWHTLACKREARGTGASALGLSWALRNFFEDGYERLLVAFVLEEWKLFRQLREPTREYALYRRVLSP